MLGLVVAGGLGVYFSRRIVRPVLQLSAAADKVAAGDYAVEVPTNAPGELAHLAERFGEMANRLAEAERIERHFLMSVSHELRTPLTAIRGHVAALLEGVVEDPELRDVSLATVQAEAQRLERLVGDILDLAKLDTHRFTVLTEEVDMGQLLDQAYESFSEEARRRSIDYRQQARDRPVIVSDGDRVLQIVGNLLSNAFRATPDGGRITLELMQTNGTVSVTVGDSGPGISPEKQERLFRPFVSESGGGTGTRARDCEGAVDGARRPDRARLARWDGARGSSSSCRLPSGRYEASARGSSPGWVDPGQVDELARLPLDAWLEIRDQELLDPRETAVHRAPALGEQFDEERQVVDASVALRVERRFDSLEATDRVVVQPLDLGQAA